MLAGSNALYFTLVDEPWSLGPGEEAPLTAKFAAASAMVLWVGCYVLRKHVAILGQLILGGCQSRGESHVDWLSGQFSG